MKSLICTHLIWWPNCGYSQGVVIGNYMRVFSRTFTTHSLKLNNWQRIPVWVKGLEIIPIPLAEQNVIEENEPREYVCAQDGL